MRISILVLAGSFIFSGCALLRSNPSATDQKNTATVKVVNSNLGNVVAVNSAFAVLTFPFGGVPGAGQTLHVYRSGKKVAELKVTGPQRGVNTVADIVSGKVQVDDEVRTD